jgi:threonine dehydrogenase-like Zn-dependent dehydrogenase
MWYAGTAHALKSGRRGYPYYPGYALVGFIEGLASDWSEAAPGRVFAMKPHGSQAVLVPNDIWCHIPAHISDEDALGLALTTTAVHAIHRSQMKAGDVVGVVGLGLVGLLTIQAALAAGAGQVVAFARGSERRALARSLGAVATDVGHDDAAAVTARVSGGRGFDVVMDCAGTAESVAVSVSAVRSQGIVAVVGLADSVIPLPTEDMFAKELTVVGVRSGGSTLPESETNRWNRAANFEYAQHLVFSGAVRTKPLVSHRFPAADAPAAYELLTATNQRPTQIVLEWSTTNPTSDGRTRWTVER